tara:strand:- start:86 stop:373 length:288 start_codon:yes stop_codon:yes gene_type:complete
MNTRTQAMLIEVFSSQRKEEMYLYVEKAVGTKEVPEALMQQFGDARSVMTLMLDPDRRLARVKATEVLAAIAEQGFFLQMPPTPEQLRRREVCDE